MSQATRDFCLRAVAYLKIEESSSSGPTIELSDADMPVLRTIGHRLLAAYLVDEGESFQYVQNRHLAEAGLSVDELHTAALQNLASIAEEKAEVRAYGSIYAVLMGGNFEASLILLDEFWSQWCAHLVSGEFAAAIPARDILAFGDSSSAEAIAELNQVCQRGSDQVDHPLTSTLYRRVDGSWLPLHG